MDSRKEGNTGRAILMCAGEYEPMEIPREAGDLVVAVDAGLERLLRQGIEPDLVLGDFDSLNRGYRDWLVRWEEAHPDRLLRLPCEKDDTDTIYAARVCLERGFRELVLYGGLGGRLDHTVANLQTLAWLKRRGANGYLLGRRTLVTALEGERVLLPEGFEGTFSLFAMDGRVTGVTLEGMKYPLSGAVLENTFPLGVSNEAGPDRRARVSVREGLALMILVSPEPGSGTSKGDAAQIPDPAKLERLPL